MQAILALLLLTDPNVVSEVETPATAVGMEARLALLRGDATRVAPREGFGFGIFGRHRYGTLGPLELALGGELYHDRFVDSLNVQGFYYHDQELTQTSFVVSHVARIEIGRFSTWVAGGAGVSVAHFYQPPQGAFPMAELSGVVPLIRGAAAVAYQAWRDTALSLQFTYNWLFNDDQVAVMGGPVKPFSDVMDIGLGAVYRF